MSKKKDVLLLMVKFMQKPEFVGDDCSKCLLESVQDRVRLFLKKESLKLDYHHVISKFLYYINFYFNFSVGGALKHYND